MEEDTQTTEDVGGDDVDKYEGLDDIQEELMRRQGTELPEPKPEGGDGETITEDSTEAQPIFTLDDGTAVTDPEEAKKGYLRHADYTRKTQELSDKRRNIDAIVNYYEAHPEKLTDLVAEMTKKPEPVKAPRQQIQQLVVPDNYKGDQFVETTVGALNQMRMEMAENRDAVDTIRQTATSERQQAEQERRLQARLMEGYKYLQGKTGDPPTPEEFGNRIEEYLREQGTTPEAAAVNIIGPDPNYIRAIVDWTFEADITAAQSDKVSSAEEQRRKRTAKSASLRVAGKTQSPQPRDLPKGKDGKTDPHAGLAMILDEQEKLTGGR